MRKKVPKRKKWSCLVKKKYFGFGLWTISLFLMSSFRHVYAAYLVCYEGSITNATRVPIERPDSLINSTNPCIDVTKSTVLFIFGFEGKSTGPAVSTIMPTFISLGNNVILVDWAKEASGGIYGPLLGYYLHAVPDTKKIGVLLGKALVTLVRLGMKRDIHIVGHSLGAQLSGYAGVEAQKEGLRIPWITALDPARPGYDTALYPAVNKTCADFVDVVHCDPGGLSLNISTGHVDLWADYGQFVNGSRLLPGCEKLPSLLDITAGGSFCNHERCILFYNVSLTKKQLFEASGAKDYNSWIARDESNTDTIYLGPLVDKRKRGNYYFTTSSSYPWGKGVNGTHP